MMCAALSPWIASPDIAGSYGASRSEPTMAAVVVTTCRGWRGYALPQGLPEFYIKAQAQ